MSIGAASPESSLKKSDGVWQQKLPDAIEDEEFRTTVASVLDGAENAHSLFFANSSSSLRKVKLDRAKRKQIIQTKVNGCGSPDISTTNHTSEERTHNEEPGSFPSSPVVKTGDSGLSQWSPLSLSQIPPCTVDSNILTQQLKNSDSGQLVRPLIKVTDSGFVRKKRKFVYTVGTLQPSQKMDSSPGIPNSGNTFLMFVKCDNVVIYSLLTWKESFCTITDFFMLSFRTKCECQAVGKRTR